MSQLCMFKPADWWDTGDDGNRIALTICRACPGIESCAGGDPKPHGVIRAGHAYSNAGTQLPICGCGYPCDDYTGGAVTPCRRCRPPKVPIPNRAHRLRLRAPRRRWRRGTENPAAKLTEPVVREIRVRYAAGESQRRLAAQFGISKSCVGTVVTGMVWPEAGGPIAQPRTPNLEAVAA